MNQTAPERYESRRVPFLNWSTLTAAVLAAGILAVDVSTPSGVAVDVLYVIPLLVGTLSGPPRHQLIAAAVASLLALIGARKPGPLTRDTIVNHAMALAVIWTTAIVLSRFRRTWLTLQGRTKDLADVNYAIDQAAIVAITDTTGAITYVNQKFCEISKYGREELLGRDHRILNSGYHPKEFIRKLWVTIANGRVWRGEIRNRAKDGSLYWVDTTIVPFLDSRGKPYQYMAIRYEITERKRSEELLREQTALARLGQMAAVVAHEVKNPIAGIRGALQVIASRMTAESRDRAVVGDIISRLDALNQIVQDLLVFARPRELRSEGVDLCQLIEKTADLIVRDPMMQGLRVNVTSAGAVEAHVDREQLQIALHNVLMNAAQAMNGQGQIDVAVEGGDAGVTMRFADRGPGVPADVREKVFDAFFTTKHRGTGLGLPTAKRIVEAHGGRVGLEERPGGGTVVSISIPPAS